MSLIVVYATDTGHVLGVLDPAGPPGAQPAVGDLVGAALPLWAGTPDGGTVPLSVPVTRLAVATVTDLPDALAVPLAFGVEVIGGEPRPDLRALEPVPSGTPPLRAPGNGVVVDVSAEGVSVTVPKDAAGNLPVLVVVAGAGGVRPVQTAEISTGGRKATFTMTLDAGSYGVLALVAGWRGVVTSADVPERP